ncbi:hypothetical protein K443DRAFT_671685 [Laccaria amethystina LaAM-08-1]|uniref:Uncharacterized protein n=1 Tax=Laccaria amethystina LaAM-08-1 TaxID=1095629 RepID=A0A0C9Y5G8_9AGAR|nr:hypothetical protein K443DRAFT_671685 [Laccaria amethystina LaAM-08-1]
MSKIKFTIPHSLCPTLFAFSAYNLKPHTVLKRRNHPSLEYGSVVDRTRESTNGIKKRRSHQQKQMRDTFDEFPLSRREIPYSLSSGSVFPSNGARDENDFLSPLSNGRLIISPIMVIRLGHRAS